MKKVLFALLGVVAVNAASNGFECPPTPRIGFTQSHTYAGWEYRTRPAVVVARPLVEVERLCPPGPTKNHPKTYFDYTTHKWVRVPACKK